MNSEVECLLFQELFTQLKHYSASVRHEALNGMKELLTTNTDLIQKHLSDILEKCFELVSDKDTVVRRTMVKNVLKVVLPSITEKQIMPFFPLVSAHLCFAMTHINDAIKVDSLLVLDLLLEHYPRLVISKSNQVLLNFIEQISRLKGDGQSRLLTTNPDSETSGMHWRGKVLTRLQKCLEAVVLCSVEDLQSGDEKTDLQTEAMDIHIYTESEENTVQFTPTYIKTAWESPGFTYG